MRTHHGAPRKQAAALALLIVLSIPAAPVSAQCLKKGSTHEQILRSRTLKAVLPAFPTEALKDGSEGVAVAQLELDETGAVKAVKILQAGHPAIERAVYAAVIQWKFKPFVISGVSSCVQGKLTFYFKINEAGEGVVRNPKIYG